MLVLASFFGWRASTVLSLKFKYTTVGPKEGGNPSIDFGTKKFKKKKEYPVGRF